MKLTFAIAMLQQIDLARVLISALPITSMLLSARARSRSAALWRARYVVGHWRSGGHEWLRQVR
jgi:hypothetical protein